MASTMMDNVSETALDARAERERPENARDAIRARTDDSVRRAPAGATITPPSSFFPNETSNMYSSFVTEPTKVIRASLPHSRGLGIFLLRHDPVCTAVWVGSRTHETSAPIRSRHAANAKEASATRSRTTPVLHPARDHRTASHNSRHCRLWHIGQAAERQRQSEFSGPDMVGSSRTTHLLVKNIDHVTQRAAK